MPNAFCGAREKIGGSPSGAAWASVNPRYANYCIAHRAKAADEMLARDTEKWPGGKMGGFILWVTARWHEWEKKTGWTGVIRVEADHIAFDVWLAKKAVQLGAAYVEEVDADLAMICAEADANEALTKVGG